MDYSLTEATSVDQRSCSCVAFTLLAALVLFTLHSGATASGDAAAPPVFPLTSRKANQVLIKSYALNPEIWTNHLFLIAMCHIAEGERKVAENVLGDLVKAEPAHYRAKRALANLYTLRGDDKEAEPLFAECWYRGRDLPALIQLARIRLEQKRLSEIDPLLEALTADDKRRHPEIRAILLGYSVTIRDDSKGRPVYAKAMEDFGTAEQDEAARVLGAGFRRLLAVAERRYAAQE